MDNRQLCLQWHSVKVTKIPENTIVLASSPLCDVQAMKVGDCAWSMQYHLEVEPDTVNNWGGIPEYRAALEQSLGKGAMDVMNQQAAELMQNFNSNCRKLFSNFLSVLR